MKYIARQKEWITKLAISNMLEDKGLDRRFLSSFLLIKIKEKHNIEYDNNVT